MGITTFDIARPVHNEAAREAAVLASGTLHAAGDPALQAVAQQAGWELSAATAAVSILYQDWQYVVAGVGVSTGVYSRRTSICGHAILEAHGVFSVLDARADTRFMNNPAVADHGVRFYAGVPLLGAGGLPLGALCVFDPQPRASFGPAEEAVLRHLGQQAEQAIRDLPIRFQPTSKSIASALVTRAI